MMLILRWVGVCLGVVAVSVALSFVLRPDIASSLSVFVGVGAGAWMVERYY